MLRRNLSLHLCLQSGLPATGLRIRKEPDTFFETRYESNFVSPDQSALIDASL